MFKRVENELELAMFNGIWTTVWLEKGFELEFSEQALERYVVVTDEGHYVGTAEIKPYGNDSPINEAAAFDHHPKIISAAGAVAEIDKMALLSTYRGHFISDLLSALVEFAESNKLKYYVTLLEPVLLRALRITFQVPVEKVSNRIFYKGDYVIPTIVDAEEVYTSKERYPWLRSVAQAGPRI
ncbi:hypothetical protein RJP21_19545 [Paenibacillus sp. VCA1]|uniref:GNAT family N-acetyltransferase n=1 Tax=Paenibacillus sp. VCA1 TaxID=3039148 RepID=UPI002871D4EA|nr:GNAT family N-acetyltransferase [Paenibacillus sp. VCA1]MDR9855813.1 hypothetical protein [Paenibacillus sp. VCA1]